MQIIGFNFSDILAKKSKSYNMQLIPSTRLDITDLSKEESALFKDKEIYRVEYDFFIVYTDSKKEEKEKKKIEEYKDGVFLQGSVLVSLDKEESKIIQKAWKKKEVPDSFKAPVFNLIFKKCSPKALQLEDEVDLPLHLPIPQLQFKQDEEN